MRIAIFGDHPLLPTGYGEQNRQLLAWLQHRGHEVAAFAFQHPFAPYRYTLRSPVAGPGTFECPVLAGLDAFAVRRSLKEFRPDVLVHNRDVWGLSPHLSKEPVEMVPAIAAHNEQEKAKAKWILYSPIDGPMYPPEFVNTWATADLGLTTTYWGVKVLRQLGSKAKELRVLYPGVDPKVFKPSGDKDLEPLGLPTDRPLITFVGTNVAQRKLIGLALAAFRSYLEHHDKTAELYLHTAPDGWAKVDELVAGMGLVGKVLARDVKGKSAMLWGYTEEQMATIYRGSACYLNLSTREGFDSPSAEAASCGCPVVVSDTPVRRELKLVGDGLWRYELAPSKLAFPEHYTLGWFSDPDLAADKIAAAVKSRGKGGVPERLRWKNLAKELEEYCRLVTEAKP